MVNKLYIFFLLFYFVANVASAESNFLNTKEVYQSATASIKNPFQGFLPFKEPVVKNQTRNANTSTNNQTNRLSKAEVVHEEPVAIPPAMNITGLVWNSKRPQAIVNGQVVDVGDTIENAKIVAINKTGIDILFDNRTITVQQ